MILVVFLVIAATGIGIALSIPKTYEAQGSILVKLGHEFMYRPETQGGAQRGMSQDEAMNNAIKIMTNSDVIKQVIATIGIGNLYPEWTKNPSPQDSRLIDVAIANFAKSLSARPVFKSNVIEVSFQHENPEMASHAVNTLIDHFKDKHIEVYSDPKSSFLEEQKGDYSERLQQAENKLQTYKQRNQVYSLDEQRNSLWQQRIGFDTNLKATQTQIREVEQKIALVKSPRWQTEGTQEGRTRLAALQIKERELLEKYTENSRMVQSIRSEMQAVKDADKKFLEEARRIELGKLEGDLAVLQAKADGYRRQVNQISGEVQALDSREKDYLNLKRELGTQEGNYKTYLAKFEEARILDDLNKRKLSNVSILQTAKVPIEPVKNKKRQYMLASIILALGAGLGLAFVREKLPQRLTTPLAAEKHLGLPVIVAIALKK
jgi:uncharacterized protein involved in exopolysaccharide biosynthesis